MNQKQFLCVISFFGKNCYIKIVLIKKSAPPNDMAAVFLLHFISNIFCSRINTYLEIFRHTFETCLPNANTVTNMTVVNPKNAAATTKARFAISHLIAYVCCVRNSL